MNRILPIAILLTIAALPAAAWTKASDVRIARKAAALAPPDLRTMLERFEGDYLRGVAAAQESNDSAPRIREQIEKHTAATIAMIRTNQPMSAVVERLGILAHYVADANSPFSVGRDDALAASRADYEAYFERRMQKFPTVFYGLARRFELRSYFDRTFARSARFYPLLHEEYFRYGERRTSSVFDDRSTAFGIASISYSRAVSDLVNLYFHIWKEAGGDVRSATAMRGSNLTLNAN